MSFKALVMDADAVDLLDSALINESWFNEFELPPTASNLKRIVIGSSCYLLSRKCDELAKVLVINLQAIKLPDVVANPRYTFERTLRVALHQFRAEVAIPLQWQPFHEGSLLSIYADNVIKGDALRLYFDTCPSNDKDNVYFYNAKAGFAKFGEVEQDLQVYSMAVSKLVDAILAEAPPVVQTGNYGLLLSQPLGAYISGSASLAEWYEKRVTAQQKDFIDRPMTAPVRLRGAAGTGKTQSIAIKALRELTTFERKKEPTRIAVVTHSAALAHDVIRGMLFAMDQKESWAEFKHAKLWLGTLYQFAQEILGYETKGLQPLSLDGREGKDLQRLLIADALETVIDRPHYMLELRSLLSSEMKGLLQNAEALVDEVMNEFAAIIDADGIQKGTAEAEQYITGAREPWQFPFSSDDRQFILDVHQVYAKELSSQGLLSMDQMIADFNRYLLTHEWRQLRDRHGFDVVFVDEYHFFNRMESASLHHLFKSTANTEGKLPLFMAYDLKQGVNDTAVRHGTSSSANFMATRAGRSELVELTEIFRSTPQIADFLKDLDGSFPALDLEGEWRPYGGISKTEPGDKPTAVEFTSNTALLDGVFEAATARISELKEGGRQVAVLCMNEKLFDQYRHAGRVKDRFVALTARDQMNELKYAKRRCVFSMPDYVAGLQFDTVFLIHVDEADFDAEGRGAGHHRRYIARCYSGASRASKRLIVACSKERGGICRILSGPIAQGSLVVAENSTI